MACLLSLKIMANEAFGTLGSSLCIKINASADFLFQVVLMYYVFSLEAVSLVWVTVYSMKKKQ